MALIDTCVVKREFFFKKKQKTEAKVAFYPCNINKQLW